MAAFIDESFIIRYPWIYHTDFCATTSEGKSYPTHRTNRSSWWPGLCLVIFCQQDVRISSSNKTGRIQCIEKNTLIKMKNQSHAPPYMAISRDLERKCGSFNWPSRITMTKTNDRILSVTVSSLTEVVDVDEIHHPKHNDCCPSWIGVAERVELVACPTGPRKKKVRKQATVRTQEGEWWSLSLVGRSRISISSWVIDRYYPSFVLPILENGSERTINVSGRKGS